jgi:hypothetical protein
VGESLARQGHLDRSLSLLVPPEGATVRQGRTARSEPWSPYGNHALALIALGRLREAEDLLSAAHESLMAQPGSLENAVVAASLAALRLEQGRVQSAFLQATSSAALFLELGLPLSARWSYSLSALSLALAGVDGKAAETLAELDALGLPTDMVYECEVLQARAWTSAARATWAPPASTSKWPWSWAWRWATWSERPAHCTAWLGWAARARSWTSSASWPGGSTAT